LSPLTSRRQCRRFVEFVAHADRLMRARNVTKVTDLRVPILFSMLTLEHPDTLVPGRNRDRLATRALASIGRLIGMRTNPDTS
jgi:hypothetical protein